MVRIGAVASLEAAARKRVEDEHFVKAVREVVLLAALSAAAASGTVGGRRV